MLPRLLYAAAVFNTDFAQIRHTSRGFSERFLSHTDLTDKNRLFYSADAAVLTQIKKEQQAQRQYSRFQSLEMKNQNH